MFVRPEQPAEPVVNGIKEESAESSSSAPPPREEPESHPMRIDTTARPPSSPAVRTMGLPDEQRSETDDPDKHMLTAIYRPDSKAAWREELRAANEQAEKVCEEVRAMLMIRLEGNG